MPSSQDPDADSEIILPLIGVFIFGIYFCHCIKLVLGLGASSMVSLLSFWLPQPALLGLSLAFASTFLIVSGIILLLACVLYEAIALKRKLARILLLPVIFVAFVVGTYAIGNYVMISPLKASASRMLERYGNEKSIGYDPQLLREVLTELGAKDLPAPE